MCPKLPMTLLFVACFFFLSCVAYVFSVSYVLFVSYVAGVFWCLVCVLCGSYCSPLVYTLDLKTNQ